MYSNRIKNCKELLIFYHDIESSLKVPTTMNEIKALSKEIVMEFQNTRIEDIFINLQRDVSNHLLILVFTLHWKFQK
jgi:hypothetical protein